MMQGEFILLKEQEGGQQNFYSLSQISNLFSLIVICYLHIVWILVEKKLSYKYQILFGKSRE